MAGQLVLSLLFLALISTICVGPATCSFYGSKGQQKKWGMAAVISKKAIDTVITIARSKLETEVPKFEIPDVSTPMATTMANFNVTASDMRIHKFRLPDISCTLHEPSSITLKAAGGEAEITGNWEAAATYKYAPIPTQAGQFKVIIRDIRFDVDGHANTARDGRPQFDHADCFDLNMDIDITMWGGTASVLGYIVAMFKTYIRNMIVKEMHKAICGNFDNLIMQANKAVPLIVLPVNKDLSVDLSLTEDPISTRDYLRVNYRGAFFAPTSKPPNFEKDSSLRQNPQYDINKERMFTLILTDTSVNTLLGALAPNVHVLVQEMSSNPNTPFRTTCPGYPPLCMGRFLRPLGQRHPHCNITIDVTPSKSPKVRFSPSRVGVSAGTNIVFNAIELLGTDAGRKHSYPSSYDVDFHFAEFRMKGNNEILIRRPEVTHFNGSMDPDPEKGFLTPADHERFLDVAGTVMEIFINDFLLENKILIPADVPLRLVNPTIRLLDGAMALETDIDFRRLFDEIVDQIDRATKHQQAQAQSQQAKSFARQQTIKF